MYSLYFCFNSVGAVSGWYFFTRFTYSFLISDKLPEFLIIWRKLVRSDLNWVVWSIIKRLSLRAKRGNPVEKWHLVSGLLRSARNDGAGALEAPHKVFNCFSAADLFYFSVGTNKNFGWARARVVA